MSRHLVHDASLAVTVGVGPGVHLVAHAWLLAVSGGRADVAAGTGLAMAVVLALAAEVAAESLGLAGKGVMALLTSAKGATLLLEVVHADWRKSRGGVVLCGVVVNFVDGNGGVNNVRLDSL